MPGSTVGLIHPGQMGVTVGAAARSAGARVVWASRGRSAQSVARAAERGLEDVGQLGALVCDSETIFSVCPPDAAVDVAKQVAKTGFSGIFVDANAISPDSARKVASVVESAGAAFVDGGIIGPPATSAGTTRIYLSGTRALDTAALFEGSLLDAHVIAGDAGAASALKMAYAAWTKGSAALLIAIRALASAEQVEDSLFKEWAISQAGLEARSDQAARSNAFKAWRFVGEMHEIADTFANVGLPDGFHRAAADIYDRLEQFKDCQPTPEATEVVAQVRKTAN